MVDNDNISSNTITPTPIETPPINPESKTEVMPEVDPVFTIKDINGGVFQIPNTLPWGKEKKVLSIVGTAFKELMPKKEDKKQAAAFNPDQFIKYAVDKFNLEDDTIESLKLISQSYVQENMSDSRINVEELLQFFAIQAPDIITKLISVITGKSESDIDEQYAGDSVLAFAVPYVIHAMKKYSGSFISGF